MNYLTVRCIKAAFVYLALGIALGASFALDRSLGPTLRPLHAELNLWGWATLLIYGMGYHMMPRFTGRPLAAPQLADVQSWLAIAGVALASVGWLVQQVGSHFAPALLISGAALQLAATAIFALLIGRLLYPTAAHAARLSAHLPK